MERREKKSEEVKTFDSRLRREELGESRVSYREHRRQKLRVPRVTDRESYGSVGEGTPRAHIQSERSTVI